MSPWKNSTQHYRNFVHEIAVFNTFKICPWNTSMQHYQNVSMKYQHSTLSQCLHEILVFKIIKMCLWRTSIKNQHNVSMKYQYSTISKCVHKIPRFNIIKTLTLPQLTQSPATYPTQYNTNCSYPNWFKFTNICYHNLNILNHIRFVCSPMNLNFVIF